MKLGDPWKALKKNVERMGGGISDFNVGIFEEPEIYIDLPTLNRGVEISLENLDDPAKNGGLLSVQGHQVLLYIQDHRGQIETVLNDPEKGRRFHIADCKTLEEMRINHKFHEKYVATNNISGTFDISGLSNNINVTGRAELKVCKNCLSRINYKGYKIGSPRGFQVFKEFELGEFFSNYSSVFKQMPRGYNNEVLNKLEIISSEEKIEHEEKCDSVCEECNVDLQGKRTLYDVVKVREGEPPLLLCLDCLRKRPHLVPIHVPRESMSEINSIRQEQQLVVNDWLGIKMHADPACYGLLEGYHQLDWTLPLIGYDIRDENQVVQTTVELAWPEISPPQAVCLDDESASIASGLGWEVFTLDEALREITQDGS